MCAKDVDHVVDFEKLADDLSAERVACPSWRDRKALLILIRWAASVARSSPGSAPGSDQTRSAIGPSCGISASVRSIVLRTTRLGSDR